MKAKIVLIEKGAEGVARPDDYLRHLELIPGAEVELLLDINHKWIVLWALHGEGFLEHFKESMGNMA